MPPKRKNKPVFDVFDIENEIATSPRTKAGKAFQKLFDESPSKKPTAKSPAKSPKKTKKNDVLVFDFSSSDESTPIKRKTASPASKREKKAPTKAAARGGRSKAGKAQYKDSSDDSSGASSNQSETPAKPAKKSGTKRARVTQDSSDSNDSSSEAPAKPAKKKPNSKRAKVVQNTDSSDSNDSSSEAPAKHVKPTPKRAKIVKKQDSPDTSSVSEPVKPVHPTKGKKSVKLVTEPTATAVFKPGNPSNVWGTADFDYEKQEKEEAESVLKERLRAAPLEGTGTDSAQQAFTIHKVPVSVDTDTLNVKELRAELSARDMIITGTKAVLKERLEKALGGPEKPKKKTKKQPKEKTPKRKKRDSLKLTFDDVPGDSDNSLSSDEALPLSSKKKSKK